MGQEGWVGLGQIGFCYLSWMLSKGLSRFEDGGEVWLVALWISVIDDAALRMIDGFVLKNSE